MNDNLLAMVQQALGGDFSRLASQFLGEPQGSTQSALGLLLPAVIGGIAQKGATLQGATSLTALMNSANLEGGSLGNLPGLFGGSGAGANALVKSGMGSLVSGVFGDKGSALANALSSASGIKPASATNLLALVVPLILGFLKKFMGDKGLNANTLPALLAAQGPYLKDSVDSRLTGALGYSSPDAFLGGLASQMSGVAKSAIAGGAAATAATARKSGRMGWLPWVIGAAALFFLWSLWSSKSAPPPVSTPAAVPEITAPAAPASETLAAALPAKIYFDVGAATIGAAGGRSIAEVANAINREGLTVAVTGYTDKSGDVAMNEELAKNRVMAVVDALKAAGVAEASIQMQPPMFVEAGVGGNDAEARRVDITRQ